MMSGIGPEEELKNHNIKQLLNLPVGKNLQDHPFIPGFVKVGKPVGQMTMNAFELLSPLTLWEFYSKGTGPSTANNMGVVGVINTPHNKDRKRPGICSSSHLNK